MLEKLRNTELHDQSVEALQIDFSFGKISLKISTYNDERAAYDYSSLIFTGVEKIKMEKMDIDDLSSVEIHSHEVYENPGLPSVKFTLLVGSGKPSAEFSFNFKEYTIITLQE